MRILIVSPYPVMPALHGGRVRALGMARGLARAGAEVTVLCPWVPWNRRSEEIEPRLRLYSHFLCANLLPATASRLAPPLALLSVQPRAFGPRRWLHRFRDHDVFQFEFCAHARWMHLVPAEATRVYSAHNVELDYHALENGRYLLAGASRARIAGLERLAMQQSDLVLACSRDDGERLSELYGPPRRLAVVPNGFDAAWSTFSGTRAAARQAFGIAPHQRTIVFVGGDAHHNSEAAVFLIREVLPELADDVLLLVAGRCLGPGSITHPRLRRLGFVADLRELLAAADLAVNPVASGSGSNVKLAEYLAAGLPVLTTPVGMRGFEHVRHPGLRVLARDEFVSALRAPWPRAEPMPEALGELTWDAIGARLFETYRRLRERPAVAG